MLESILAIIAMPFAIVAAVFTVGLIWGIVRYLFNLFSKED